MTRSKFELPIQPTTSNFAVPHDLHPHCSLSRRVPRQNIGPRSQINKGNFLFEPYDERLVRFRFSFPDLEVANKIKTSLHELSSHVRNLVATSFTNYLNPLRSPNETERVLPLQKFFADDGMAPLRRQDPSLFLSNR